MKTILAYSLDKDIRYKSTSGGVGSALLKYLFEHGVIQTAISFDFDAGQLQFNPKLIYSFSDYKFVGSIYQEIGLIDFIKRNISEIKGGFACFCLPCQTKAIRRLVENANHSCYLLGLTCSSQQKADATYYLLKRLNIRKEDVRQLQYRGNGWPSGIQIELRSGQTIIVPNNNSLWSQIFHSRLFILQRCFKCSDTLNRFSDISLADPWLEALQGDIQGGKTLVMLNTDTGSRLWMDASEYICASTVIADGDAFLSQNSTINRKLLYFKHPNRRNLLMKMNKSMLYKRFVLMHSFLFQLHCKLKALIER